MKIGILGCKGIPNNHGGYEQFAQYLTEGLVRRGHEVYIYNSHTHYYKESTWNGVNILHQYDPEFYMGASGQFVYDFNSILDSRKREFDILYQLGYLSNSVWHRLLPKRSSVIVTNMDGLEWKRSKWNKPTQLFLKYAERLAANSSHYLIADSIGIQNHLKDTYNKESIFIPYGATLFDNPDETALNSYELQPYKYDLILARMEPENNIEAIIKGYLDSGIKRTLLIIGGTSTKYGKYLTQTYKDEKIRFIGGVYNIEVLNNLRYFSEVYFHGHSVGGTNPSLLEAMASDAMICAHDNIFNRSILGEDAYYFRSSDEVSFCLSRIEKNREVFKLENNRKKIEEVYNWDKIIADYEQCFYRLTHHVSAPEVSKKRVLKPTITRN